jgi:hypothetical protein
VPLLCPSAVNHEVEVGCTAPDQPAGTRSGRLAEVASTNESAGSVGGVEVAAGRSGPRSRVLVQCSGRQVENNTEECERAPREVAGDGAAVAWQGTGGQT